MGWSMFLECLFAAIGTAIATGGYLYFLLSLLFEGLPKELTTTIAALLTVALFGGLHPLGTIPASWLFGALLVGADKMQRAVQVPSALIDTLLGLVVLFMVGSQMLSRKWARRHQISLEAARKEAASVTAGQATAEVQS